MRITGIEIANYRGFAGDSFQLLLEKGENLLVYGENGAGKSSFYNTLNDFLRAASHRSANIEQHRNRFRQDAPAVRLRTALGPTSWTPTEKGQNTDEWRKLDDGKGFFDYRLLLRFYNAPKDRHGRIDLFRLLLEGMLSHHKMEISDRPTFLAEWRDIELAKKGYLNSTERAKLSNRVAQFNAAFKIAVNELGSRATQLLQGFDSTLTIAFIFTNDANFYWYPKTLIPPCVVAEPQLPDRASITNYDDFFNEARLSAMAISLFFAALKSCPIEGPRLLVLDDVLIGLDMGNRRKCLDLVQNLFSDWQIIILTYHKAWFEVLKSRIKVGNWDGNEWRSAVLRPVKCVTSSLLTIAHAESGTALETADRCLEHRDYKAAAVYARTALEAVFQKYADSLHLPVQFKIDRLKLDTDDFLNPLEKKFGRLVDLVKKAHAEGLVAELRFVRRTVLNAYAHADEISEDEIAGEINHGIQVVRQFETFLASLEKDDFQEDANVVELSIAGHLAIASEMAAVGNLQAALLMTERAAKALVQRRCELKMVKLPYRRRYPHSMLFGLAFQKADLSLRGEAVLRMVEPYLLGKLTTDHLEPTRFAAALRFIAHVDLLDTLAVWVSRAGIL